MIESSNESDSERLKRLMDQMSPRERQRFLVGWMATKAFGEAGADLAEDLMDQLSPEQEIDVEDLLEQIANQLEPTLQQ